MQDFPETRDSLIIQVKDPHNREAWDQFTLLYRPVIYRLARQKGMQEADAQDLAQQVLLAVSAAIGRWERSKPEIRFRHWLRRVARNAILNALSRQPPDKAVGGTAVQALLQEHPQEDSETESQIELEYRRELYLHAARIVQSDVQRETWKAFEITVVEGVSVEDAANKMEMAIGSVYAARSRVMRRLREVVQRLEQSEL